MDFQDWTPTQHKQEALRLLHEADGMLFSTNAAICLARAQIHATLATIHPNNEPTTEDTP